MSIFRTRDARGAAAVEFAFVMVPLLMILFGIIQYAFYFWSMQGGADASRQAARLAAVGKPLTCADLSETEPGFQSIVKRQLKTVSSDPSNATVTRSYTPAHTTGEVEIGDTVTVKVEFKGYDFNLPFVPFIDNAMVSQTAEARVDYVPAQPETCS